MNEGMGLTPNKTILWNFAWDLWFLYFKLKLRETLVKWENNLTVEWDSVTPMSDSHPHPHLIMFEFMT